MSRFRLPIQDPCHENWDAMVELKGDVAITEEILEPSRREPSPPEPIGARRL